MPTAEPVEQVCGWLYSYHGGVQGVEASELEVGLNGVNIDHNREKSRLLSHVSSLSLKSIKVDYSLFESKIVV